MFVLLLRDLASIDLGQNFMHFWNTYDGERVIELNTFLSQKILSYLSIDRSKTYLHMSIEETGLYKSLSNSNRPLRCRYIMYIAHNVSIRNIKVSKRERHITYSITKHTYVCNPYIMCTLHFEMVYVL